MKTFMKTSYSACLAVVLAAAAASFPVPSGAQTFSEPSTVFYGKVLGTGSAQDFLITDGVLQWTILRADGSELKLATSLYAFHDGTLSYRLNVPHSAFALGLDETSNGIPLPPTPQTHVHALVTVDGETATLLGPAGSSFTSDQLMRTATYRMDLALGRAATDTDGDGMADWWEDANGLDKQNPGDASLDLSGDGITALQAYLQGLDPNQDHRAPALLTDEIIVYPVGTTALLLDVKDLDSTAAQLRFTVTSLPNAGSLVLRNAQANPADPDTVLDVGGTFTLADVRGGRVVYEHDRSASQPGMFAVEVRDENPDHPAFTGEIDLLPYEPALYVPDELSALEARRVDNYLLAAAGHVIMDGSDLPAGVTLSVPSSGLDAAGLAAFAAAYGDDRPYAMVDTAGNDTLTGGQQHDVLFSGAGNDTLAGGPGPDWFVFKDFGRGLKTIADFSVAGEDVIDFGLLPAVPGAFAHSYLRIVSTGGVYRLQTDLDGNGSGFTNLAVALPGLAAADADLYKLVAAGRLLIGDLVLEPRISVAATVAQASENGPGNGVFTLTRDGSLDGDLVVNLTIGGSAQNGTDYATVLNTVVMPEGVASVDVVIEPYADSIAETAETVQLIVAAGVGYRVGPSDRATLTIEDLLMQVSIEVLEPLAVKEGGTPAVFLITRSEVINRDVVVRLTIGGTAANGTDYNTVSSFVLIPAFNTTALISVTPKPTASLSGGLETVVVTVKADAAYRVSGEASATVAIVERIDTFDAWQAREFPDAQGGLTVFADGDSGATGVTHFERYAFGLDALASDTSGLPYPLILDGRLAVTFRKPLGVSDVTYRVIATTDLSDWSGGTVALHPVAGPDGSTDPQRLYYQADAAADDAGEVFIMVEAEWVP